MNKNLMNKKTDVTKLILFCIFGVIAFSLFMASGDIALAASSPGQNFGEWLLDQAFWIALAVIAIVLIPLIVKKNWVMVFIVMIIAAIVLVVISNPARLQTLGDMIWSAFGL